MTTPETTPSEQTGTQPTSKKKPKMVIVMRTDLNMGVGKMIAQAGHAITELVLKRYLSYTPEDQKNLFEFWINNGMKKVTLGVDSEAGLLAVENKAFLLQVPCYLVTDAGLTQNAPGTRTCIAIGPAKDKRMEKITGHLKLLP